MSQRIALAGAALLVAVRLIMPLEPPDNEANPWKLIAMVPPQLRSQPVLNGYSMGGPLILSGIRPYIDGRGDMYGDELVVGYSQHRPRRRRLRSTTRSGAGTSAGRSCPTRAKLIGVIQRSPDWRLVARDKVGVIYVRRNLALPKPELRQLLARSSVSRGWAPRAAESSAATAAAAISGLLSDRR